jgi:hypothetical protein
MEKCKTGSGVAGIARGSSSPPKQGERLCETLQEFDKRLSEAVMRVENLCSNIADGKGVTTAQAVDEQPVRDFGFGGAGDSFFGAAASTARGMDAKLNQLNSLLMRMEVLF